MRRVVGVLALALCTGFVAGCGGSAVQQAADRYSKEFLGDPHPRLARTEIVRVADGKQAAVITVQGHFKYSAPCAPGFSSCRPFDYSRYAVLMFSLPNPKTWQGFSSSSTAQVAAIASARRANPLFRLFPDFASQAVLCGIRPRGFPGVLPGSCATQILSNDFLHPRRVEFSEHWPRAKNSLEPGGGGWVVTLGRNDRVLSVRVTGGVPPQLWTFPPVVRSGASPPRWLRALALRQARLLHDPRPSLTRFHIGGHDDVVELWGSFTCPRHCFFFATDRRFPRVPWVRLVVDPLTHSLLGIGDPSSKSPTLEGAIRRAHSLRGYFGAFPRSTRTIPCQIDAGGTSPHKLSGRCTTALAWAGPYGGQTNIAFIERWGKALSHRGGWVVTLGPWGSPLHISRTGQTPPQLRK